MLDGTAEGVLHGLVTDNNGKKILVWVNIVVVPGIECNLFSVMTAAKKGVVTIFDYENSRLEGFNVIVRLRSESGALYSFVLDLNADRYGVKVLALTQSPIPRCGTSGWVTSIHRAWVFYASETALL